MWVLLILVLLQVEVSVPAARDVGRGMRCQRPHSGCWAGECPWESLSWAEGPAEGPALAQEQSRGWVSCSLLCVRLQQEST